MLWFNLDIHFVWENMDRAINMRQTGTGHAKVTKKKQLKLWGKKKVENTLEHDWAKNNIKQKFRQQKLF